MSKKKVITVQGDNSKWYEKVVFVVKKDKKSETKNIDFVIEAEKIITDYMLKSDMAYSKHKASKTVTKGKKNNIDGIDIFLITSICICLLMMFVLFMNF